MYARREQVLFWVGDDGALQVVTVPEHLARPIAGELSMELTERVGYPLEEIATGARYGKAQFHFGIRLEDEQPTERRTDTPAWEQERRRQEASQRQIKAMREQRHERHPERERACEVCGTVFMSQRAVNHRFWVHPLTGSLTPQVYWRTTCSKACTEIADHQRRQLAQKREWEAVRTGARPQEACRFRLWAPFLAEPGGLDLVRTRGTDR